MALHALFEEKVDRDAFLKGFDVWCERTRKALEGYKAPVEKGYRFPSMSFVPETTDLVGPLHRASKRINWPSSKPKNLEARLTEILNRAANKLDVQQKGIKERYGFERYCFDINAAHQIDSLPAIQRATLHKYADEVRQLFGGANNVIELHGSRQPKGMSQQAEIPDEAPAAQMR